MRLVPASAALTMVILRLSAVSAAATRNRCAALIEFMASLTFGSGSISIINVLRIVYLLNTITT